MTTDQDKAAAVLLRCGPFSRVAAERLAEDLTAEELAELGALYEAHAANPAGHQGGRFQDLLNTVADRRTAEKRTA